MIIQQCANLIRSDMTGSASRAAIMMQRSRLGVQTVPNANYTRKAQEGYLQQRREQACRLRVLTQSRSASHGESPPQSGHGDDLCTVTYLQLTKESLDSTFSQVSESLLSFGVGLLPGAPRLGAP